MPSPSVSATRGSVETYAPAGGIKMLGCITSHVIMRSQPWMGDAI